MQKPQTTNPAYMDSTVSEPVPWPTAIADLLAQAARLCVQHDLDIDTFMTGAWSAYLEARPGMRDFLEDLHLRKHFEELRKHGRMGEA